MLGRPYPVAGEIIPGKGRGKRLGFPTANIRTEPEKLLPPPGVYIAIDGAGKPGLLYIGTSPTFGDVEMGIEFHRIDPKNYKIGGSIEISIFERIRGEIKFENERKLVAQMEKDKDKLTEWALNSGAKVQVKK